jgi:hypothetical protein
MTRRGILLRLLMDELRIDAKLGTFSSRLQLQKQVYLLQSLGLPTEFSYNWYLRGPYSPGLTKVAFEEVVEPSNRDDRTYEEFKLSSSSQGLLDRLSRMKEQRPEPLAEEDDWLELLASMLFYRHEMYFPPDKSGDRGDPEWLYQQLPTTKRNKFKPTEAVSAKKALEEAGLW